MSILSIRKVFYILVSYVAFSILRRLFKKTYLFTIGRVHCSLAMGHSTTWKGAAITLCAMYPTSTVCWASLVIAAFSDGQST